MAFFAESAAGESSLRHGRGAFALLIERERRGT
jgi:hypothetical protein